MKTDFKRVCIVYTPYSLYLYLLYSNEEELNNTFFFFGEGIHKGIRDKFENKYFFSDECYSRRNVLSRLIYRIKLRNQSRKIWPFLADAHIFAQDIFFFSAALIGKRNYTMIEDAPNVIHRWRNLLNKPKSIYTNILITVKELFHKYMENSFYGEMGFNAQCNSVLITNAEYDPILKDKQVIQVDEMDYWYKSTESKKNKILSIYDLTEEDLTQLKKRKIILFSENFTSIGWITEQELVDIYAQRLDKYAADEIIIKKHAFDRTDYRKHFPNIYVFDKVIPMQLLNLLGIHYETAITICSSAVLSFPYDIQIEWIGTECHPKLLAAMGKQSLADYKIQRPAYNNNQKA